MVDTPNSTTGFKSGMSEVSAIKVVYALLNELTFAGFAHEELVKVRATQEHELQTLRRIIAEHVQLKADLLEARDLVMDLFNQACRVSPPVVEKTGYDHMCMSTYEEAQRCLIEWRMLDKEECIRK